MPEADSSESRSSVAVIERAGRHPVFWLEHRKTSGKYPYAGKYGLFGGGSDTGEDHWMTLFREIDEELGIYIPKGQHSDWEYKGESRVCGEGRSGAQIMRSVRLFHLLLPAGSRLISRESMRSTVVQVPVTAAGIRAVESRLTPYTHEQLTARIDVTGFWKKNESGIWR